MRRALLFAASVGTLAATAIEAQAPETRPAARTPRSLIFGLVGAAIGAGAAALYMSASDEGVTPGLCSQDSCVITFSVGLGTLVGYTIGREFDQLHKLRYRGRAALRPSDVAAPLTGEPLLLVARDSLVVAGGPGGLQIFTSRDGLAPSGIRAAGIRGISALDIAGRASSLAVGSASGTYLYPPAAGPGSLIREGEARALAAGSERIYIAAGTRILAAPLDADTTGDWPGVDAGGLLETLAWDRNRGLLWAVADSVLLAFRPAGDSLDKLGQVVVGPAGRRLAISGDRIAVASGENGVRIVDGGDPAQPVLRWHWQGARFVYDVSLFEQRLYVAAGVEGVYVLDVSGPSPVVLGLARDLGFATALAASGSHTFVLDRGSNTLRRFRSDF